MQIRAKVGIPAWVDVKRIQAHTKDGKFKFSGSKFCYTDLQDVMTEFRSHLAVEFVKRINK